MNRKHLYCALIEDTTDEAYVAITNDYGLISARSNSDAMKVWRQIGPRALQQITDVRWAVRGKLREMT